MEAFDIEDIDFNEYNRRVYEEEDEDNYSINTLSKKLFRLNPQERYSIEINKYVEEYNKVNPQKKTETENQKFSKKENFKRI